MRDVVAIHWKLEPLVIATDDAHGVAWFQAPAALTINVPYSGMQCCQSSDAALRTSGIVVRDKDKSWHVATLALSRPIPDAELFHGATEDVPDTDPTVDDTALAKAVAGHKKKAAPMTLYAIATRDDKGAWRWGSLQWTTVLAKTPVAPPEAFQSTTGQR